MHKFLASETVTIARRDFEMSTGTSLHTARPNERQDWWAQRPNDPPESTNPNK